MTVIDGVLYSGVIAAWVAGLLSAINLTRTIKENKRRDEGQFERDDAHIAITMYDKIKKGENKQVEDDVVLYEVGLYEKILGEVKTKREARK